MLGYQYNFALEPASKEAIISNFIIGHNTKEQKVF